MSTILASVFSVIVERQVRNSSRHLCYTQRNHIAVATSDGEHAAEIVAGRYPGWEVQSVQRLTNPILVDKNLLHP